MSQATNVTSPALIQAFAFDSHAVRVIHKDGEPWFVAKDVCQCLSIANHRNVTNRLDTDEKDCVQIMDAIGRLRDTTVINESGLYAVILRSDGATTPGHPAHTFRKWVTAQVLPSLRKTGSYTAPGAAPVADIDARLDRIITVLEKLVELLPRLVGHKTRRPRRQMCEADLVTIAALRAQNAMLADIVAITGLSQTQVWCAIEGRIQVKPGGRVVIKAQSEAAQAAAQAGAAQ